MSENWKYSLCTIGIRSHKIPLKKDCKATPQKITKELGLKYIVSVELTFKVTLIGHRCFESHGPFVNLSAKKMLL